MRILHVIPALTHERGGSPVAACAMARHQARAGHRVVVLTTNLGERRGQRRLELDEAVTVERLRIVGPDRLAYAPAFTASARAWVRASDLVHVHTLFRYPVHVALREAAVAGVPVVVQPHGTLHSYSLGWSRWPKFAYLKVWGRMVRRACSAWLYSSDDEAVRSWPWDSSSRLILPYGVEPADYRLDRNEARGIVECTWPQLGGSPYVLFLGRLHPKKRPDLLLQAFVAGAPPTFKLVVAGPDECGLWARWAAEFVPAGVRARRVLYVGTVIGRVKAALLAAASLFALPSEHENFAIAALEALAAGTPVLLSPHVDLAIPVHTAGLGYLAPLDVAAWSEQLASLLADTGKLGASGVRARRWAQEQYAWSRITGELIERYGRLLNRV